MPHPSTSRIDYVIAGASSIEDIPRFVEVAEQAGLAVLLLENESMWRTVPVAHQRWITRGETIPCGAAPVIPLNEFWVSRAIQTGVHNISHHALRASRSKHYLSARLRECGLPAVPRRYLEDIAAPGPARYLARLDAAYSGYGIVRHVEGGSFDADRIRRAVQGDASASMRSVLGDDQARVVVEDWLEGEEFSADIFVDRGKVAILRMFRKIMAWTNGRPVCDSYIAVPESTDLNSAVQQWCAALFGAGDSSFGQFDIIVAGGHAMAVDFSCRIGGGLGAIKRFARVPSYVATALSGRPPSFAPFCVQKNIVARRGGRLARIESSIPDNFEVTLHKRAGDLLPTNLCSANARVAEVCFAARDLADAVATAARLDKDVMIHVHD